MSVPIETKEPRALVTGASEGIGREFALQLAARGYRITAVARNRERLEELLDELPGEGHELILTDLSDIEGISQVGARIERGGYRLLVNNAGSGLHGSFSQLPLEKLQAMSRLNCDSLVTLSYAFLKNSRPGDALINVASTLGHIPAPGAGLYAATKAFVTSLSETLWFEQKSRGVYVMSLCPGATVSRFADRAGVVNQDLHPLLVQSAQAVVSRAIKELDRRRRPLVFTSWINRLITAFLRGIPRPAAMSILHKAGV